MTEFSIPAVLRERASLQPHDTAFTFRDYERDWAGFPESLTWSQVYRRALKVAPLRLCASTGDGTEKLVAIIELKKRGDTEEAPAHKLNTVKGEITSAISNSHGLNVADLVVVAPGSIPTTTSAKVRRAACVEQYRHNGFTRIDV